MGWAKVTGPAATAGRNVHINGNYDDADSPGPVGGTYEVEDGQNTFETLDDDGDPEFGATLDVAPTTTQQDPQRVVLKVLRAPKPAPAPPTAGPSGSGRQRGSG